MMTEREIRAAMRTEAGRRALAFFANYLTHSKGEHAGQPFHLLPWQRRFIGQLFGTLRPDGLRRYRQAYVEIPRKNGKSSTAAGIALLLLCADNEPGAEIYSAAADKEQAALVFNEAKSMVEQNDDLRKRLVIYRSAIVFPEKGSSYKAISAEAYTKHGINAHGIIFDELHAQPSAELWEVLNTSTGARRQPLTVAITTAGFDRNSFCYLMHTHALKVLSGEIQDDSFLPLIYAAGPDEDFTDEKVWARANPSLGVTLKMDYMRSECARAKMMPSYENTFRRLHLNQWTETDVRWISSEAWAKCGGPIDVESLRGQRCFGGLDLASKVDLAAFVLYFPESHAVLPFFWTPGDSVRQRAERDRVPYDVWIRNGLIEATEGNVIDYAFIRKRINELSAVYQIEEIGFDPWNATQMATWLMDDGAKVCELRQGFQTLSNPTKELEKLVIAAELRHGDNDVLTWMASNVTTKEDENGNIRPNKAKSTGRIDGIVALIMALQRANVKQEPVVELSFVQL